MANSARAEGVTPELRASIFHFSVYGPAGVGAAYFAIWLSDRGIPSDQIGIINAAPVLLLLLGSMLIGRLADRASDWRVVILILSLLSGLAAIGFLFVNEFWGAMLVFILSATPGGALVPVLDAATLCMTTRRGSDFGAIRGAGTLGYMLATAGTGALIGWLGGIVFVPLFIALSLLRAGLAFQLPRFRAPEGTAASPARSGVSMRSLMRPWFLLPCLAFALVQATHFFVGTMGSLVWKLDGIGDAWFGPLIGLSAAAEAVTMFLWRRIGTRMTARTMLIIGAAASALRWFGMAFSPSLPVLFALQALHAVTLPFNYFGIMYFIGNWAPEEIAAESQSFAWALAQGASVLTLLAFGWLVGIMGGQAFFVASGMSLLAIVAVWWSLRLRPAHASLASDG